MKVAGKEVGKPVAWSNLVTLQNGVQAWLTIYRTSAQQGIVLDDEPGGTMALWRTLRKSHANLTLLFRPRYPVPQIRQACKRAVALSNVIMIS